MTSSTTMWSAIHRRVRRKRYTPPRVGTAPTAPSAEWASGRATAARRVPGVRRRDGRCDVPRAGARQRGDLPGVGDLVALGAPEVLLDEGAAAAVGEEHRRAVRTRLVAVAPVHQRDHDRV